MGIFPDVLEQVYDIVIEHKLRHTGLDEAAPKLKNLTVLWKL